MPDPKFIAILGAGESGVGAAILAQRLGVDCLVSEQGTIADGYRAELTQRGIPFEEGGHSLERLTQADLVIKSPGIPHKAEAVKHVLAKGIPLVSEIEFAARHTSSRIIAVTGSNGKTTTTSLIYHMLRRAGLDAGLGGNIGRSFAALVAEAPHPLYVLEVSSFQLDDVDVFRPHIALLLNITENHLDRYQYNLSAYAAAKFNIGRRQTEADYFIYGLDSPVLMAELARYTQHTPLHGQLLGFSRTEQAEAAAWIDRDALGNDLISVSMNRDPRRKRAPELQVPTSEQKLKGKHNQYNSMASAIVGRVLEIRNEIVRESLTDFEGLEHRLEKVATVNGALYINDSKATSVNAAWYALESIESPMVWIVGGVDKGNDYGMLLELVKQKVKAVVMLGRDVTKIQTAFQGQVPTLRHALSMENAVQMAYQEARAGDTVLLSPACASFDLFANYEERGRRFKDCVRRLRE